MVNKFNSPVIYDEDIENVVSVIKSGWLIHGKYHNKLEAEIRDLTGAKYCMLLSSCTAALHLSLLALGTGKGDEVIVPAQSHVATAHSVEYTGAKAVIVDVDPVTGNVAPESVLKAISKKTKVILPVHLAGVPCDMKVLKNIAKDNSLFIIEDCAHSIGSVIGNKHVGTFGEGGSFSFYPTKHFTTGEGGAFVTNKKSLYEKVSKLRAFGINTPIKMRKLPGKYDVKHLGYNYRMTDFQAALGYGQFIRLRKRGFEVRKSIVKKYREGFKGNKNIFMVPEKHDKNSSYMFFPIYVNGKARDNLLLRLKALGIGVSVHYMTPIPFMTYYKKKYRYNTAEFKNAKSIGKRQVCLPLQVDLSDKQINGAISTINKETK